MSVLSPSESSDFDEIPVKPEGTIFRPYVPASANEHELTISAVLLGAILGIIFGASSLYLVLRVGMTVSASIPVAVLSITVFRGLSSLFNRRSATILENNIVQTTGSAGESIAFGVGVTMPALLILGYDMDLDWKAVHRASNYNVYRDTVRTGVMDIFSCTTHVYNDATVISGETYQYYVVAEDQGHQSPQSAVVPVEVKSVSPPFKTRGALPAPVNPDTGWALEDMRRVLAELRQKDNKTVLAILNMAASQPDTRVAFSDVCQRAVVTGR